MKECIPTIEGEGRGTYPFAEKLKCENVDLFTVNGRVQMRIYHIEIERLYKCKAKLSLRLTNQALLHEDVWGDWLYRSTFS
jgi:hypothetical protein